MAARQKKKSPEIQDALRSRSATLVVIGGEQSTIAPPPAKEATAYESTCLVEVVSGKGGGVIQFQGNVQVSLGCHVTRDSSISEFQLTLTQKVSLRRLERITRKHS